MSVWHDRLYLLRLMCVCYKLMIVVESMIYHLFAFIASLQSRMMRPSCSFPLRMDGGACVCVECSARASERTLCWMIHITIFSGMPWTGLVLSFYWRNAAEKSAEHIFHLFFLFAVFVSHIPHMCRFGLCHITAPSRNAINTPCACGVRRSGRNASGCCQPTRTWMNRTEWNVRANVLGVRTRERERTKAGKERTTEIRLRQIERNKWIEREKLAIHMA